MTHPERMSAEAQGAEVCSDCQGDGWLLGHEDQCYAKGACECSGVQEWCDRCRGTGRAAAALTTQEAEDA